MKKKHPVRRILLILIFALIVAGLAALPVLTKMRSVSEDRAKILNTEAERRAISRTLSYGAPLETQEAAEITLPQGVAVVQLLVDNGDAVKTGDTIAKVDSVSVMTAVKQVQESLDQIAAELKTVRTKVEPGVISVNDENELCVNGKKIEDSKLSDYFRFLTLSQQHRDYEEILLELFRIYQTGEITAPCDGIVTNVDQTAVKELSASGAPRWKLLAVNSPEGEDDSRPHYCYVGRIELVKDGSWLLRRGSDIVVTDFLNLEGLDASLKEEIAIFDPSGFSVFRYAGDRWTVAEAQPGDAVLVDELTGWILVIGTSEEEEPKETEPEENEPEEVPPEEPGDEDKKPDAENPEEKPGEKPGNSNFGGLQINIGAMMGGSRGGMGGASGMKEEESLYSTEKTLLAAVTPMETMRLTLSVDEMDVPVLQTGMSAQVTFEALPNQVFSAVVTQVSQFGTNAGGSSKFAVVLELPGESNLLPGMNAKVKIVTQTQQDCLTVPVAALVDEGNRTMVYTGYDEKNETLVKPVPVETGLSDGEYAQILSGLTEGQQIWYSYYDEVEISNAVEKRGMFG